MTQWEPATDAEVAMRNALRTDDQESYFRILAGVDLLLPVSADALAGREPLGWGTWSTGGRTHVLAFTSPAALQACLADYTGSARRVAYQELAETWPNLEWWLAVNPGLPVEGYLPAWFVAQLSRGDLRLPTRGPGREGSNGPNRIPDIHAAAALAANAAAQTYADPASGGPVQGVPGASESPAAPAISAAESPFGAAASSRYDSGNGAPAGYQSGGAAPGFGAPASSAPSGFEASHAPAPGFGASGGQASGFGASGGEASGFGASAGQGTGSGASPGFGAAGGNGGFGAAPSGSRPAGGAGQSTDSDQGRGGNPIGPGGLPLRTPGAVLPSGLPSRVPSTPPGMGGGAASGSSFSGFTPVNSGRSAAAEAPSQPPVGATPEPAAVAGGVAPATQAIPTLPGFGGSQNFSAGATAGHGASPSQEAAPAQSAAGGLAGAGAARQTSPSGFTAFGSGSALDALASRTGTTAPASGPSALDALGSRGGAATRPGFGESRPGGITPSGPSAFSPGTGGFAPGGSAPGVAPTSGAAPSSGVSPSPAFGGAASPTSGAAAMPTSGAATMPTSGAATMPTSGAAVMPTSGAGDLPVRPGFAGERTAPPALPPLQPNDGPLPVRKPMAQTPPLPSHIAQPAPGSPGAESPAA
uniref:SseB family protein n=1 Tax=Actinoplanes sp. RD1 TaxID=3064538 RepID=UPI0027417A73